MWCSPSGYGGAGGLGVGGAGAGAGADGDDSDVPPAAADTAAADAGAAAEPTEVNVTLTEVGGTKVAVIKAVREITGLGLVDAKGLVDKAPSVIKEKVSADEAKEIKEKLEAAGATVEVK